MKFEQFKGNILEYLFEIVSLSSGICLLNVFAKAEKNPVWKINKLF